MGDTPPPADGGLDIIDFADGGGQEQQQGSGDAQLDVIDFGDDGGQQEQGLQDDAGDFDDLGLADEQQDADDGGLYADDGGLYADEDDYADEDGGSEFYGGEDLGEDEDDAGDLEIMDPNHPALKRFQEALKRQLLAQRAELEAETREKSEAAKAAKRQREDLGVQLYNVQQQLSRLQMKLEAAHDQHLDVTGQTQRADDIIVTLRKEHDKLESELSQVRKQTSTLQGEYDRKKRSALQAQQETEAIRGEVEINKRAAKKAARVEDEVENEKQQQDLYVDRLSERAKQLQSEITIMKTQLKAQEDETKSTRQALQEATSEVDAIRMEKRELQTQWTNSLAGLSKRNEALAAMEAAVREQQQEVYAKQREVEGIKKLIVQERQENEVHTASLARAEADLTQARKQLEATYAKIDQTKREYSMLTKSLKTTEEDLQRSTTEYNIQNSNLAVVRKAIERTARGIRENENVLMNKTYDSVTLDKAGKALAAKITQTRAQREEVENDISQAENDVARVHAQISEFDERIEEATAQLKRAEAEVDERNNLISQYETQIRRNNTTIQRKQTQIDMLNRRIQGIIDKRVAQGEGNADIGPAEIEINALQRQIVQLSAENADLQRVWLSRQVELVNMSKEQQAMEQGIAEGKTRLTVLAQKKYRLDSELSTTEKEKAELRRAFTSLQQDLVRLNTLINKNHDQRNTLEQDNVLMESEFLRQLKADELESIQLQESVQEAEEERAALLNALVDAEENILLWEKKIQLAKEMRDQLKPSDGTASEITAMGHEIHRMELRLDQLNKQKESLIQEMERSVVRRETIAVKAKSNAKRGGGNATQGALKKEILELRKRVQQTLVDAQRCQKDIDELRTAKAQVTAEINALRNSVARWEQAEAEVHKDIGAKASQRTVNLSEIVYHQRCAQHLAALGDGKVKLRHKDHESYDKEIQQLSNTLQSLNAVTEYLMREHDELQAEMSEIVTTINAKLDQLSGMAAEAAAAAASSSSAGVA